MNINQHRITEAQVCTVRDCLHIQPNHQHLLDVQDLYYFLVNSRAFMLLDELECNVAKMIIPNCIQM